MATANLAHPAMRSDHPTGPALIITPPMSAADLAAHEAASYVRTTVTRTYTPPPCGGCGGQGGYPETTVNADGSSVTVFRSCGSCGGTGRA